jgi:hypothetical protein
MTWASTSKLRIAVALHYPQQQQYLIDIVAGMNAVEKQGQQSIDYVESLLDEYDAIDASLAASTGDAGLIQADVLRWSDRPGAKLSAQFDRLALIATRISAALDICSFVATTGNGGACRSTRS